MSEAGGAPGSTQLTGIKLWATGIMLALGNFMVVLDVAIANVSVPHIAGALAVSPTQGTWVITSYSVAEAITVPLSGWLAQRFGPAKVFAFGMAGFGVFSFACGFAPTFELLVLGRVLQGVCGGPIMPMSQTLLLTTFPKEKSNQAIGLWSMTTVLAPVAGPILGGYISDNIGWSWIFFINIPVAAGVAFGTWTLLRKSDRPGQRVPVDYVGLSMLIVWVGALQIMLDSGKELDWFSSPRIIVLAIIAAIGFLAFLIWELTAENPIVNLRVFRHRGFVAGVITSSVAFGAFFSTLVLVPLWLQTTMGYTASKAGLAAGMNGILGFLLSPLVARLVTKVDSRILVSFGICWLGMVSVLRSFYTTDLTFMHVSFLFFLQGVALPFFFVPTASITLSSVNPEETASAAGLHTFLRTTTAAFATSIMTTLWANIGQSKRALLAGRLNDAPGAMSTLTTHGLGTEQARGVIDRLVEVQAVMLATNRLFLVAVALFAVAACTIWIAPKPKPRPFGGGGH